MSLDFCKFKLIGWILVLFWLNGYADYHQQKFTSYYVGEKLTADHDSIRVQFSIPDSGAVLAGFITSSETDWQISGRESAVLDICVDLKSYTRQVVISYMGKKFEYPRYLWELGAGQHYIDLRFKPSKSSPQAKFITVDSIKIAVVRPDDPYFYPCLLIPYLNSYKIYSNNDIPLVIHYSENRVGSKRRYYYTAIFSHDDGHLTPGAENPYCVDWIPWFKGDRANSLDVEWMWDATIDTAGNRMTLVEAYYQGGGHGTVFYSWPYWNFHPTIKVDTQNNNFSYGFGYNEQRNRYPQMLPPVKADDYHECYDTHPELFIIWAKEIRRDYGIYDFANRNPLSPFEFLNGYVHQTEKFDFTDPIYHLFFEYNLSNAGGRLITLQVKLKGNDRWYGRQVESASGGHWQSIVMPDFINLQDVDSIKVTAGISSKEVGFSLKRLWYLDKDCNYINHHLAFPAGQKIAANETKKQYALKGLLSNELTLHKFMMTVEQESVMVTLPFSGDVNATGVATFYLKKQGERTYQSFPMQRFQEKYVTSVPSNMLQTPCDIMIAGVDADGVNGYSPQYLESINLAGLTDVGKKEQMAQSYSLAQNYPNPCNSSTMIQYTLPVGERVRLSIFDLQGRQIASLVNTTQSAGVYSIRFDASRFASGVYFYRLVAGQFVETKKLTLLK